MPSFRLPNKNSLTMLAYRGIDEEGKPANIYYSYLRGDDCLLDVDDDNEPLVLYTDVNDSDIEFIIGTASGRLTDELARKYGFESAEAAYDEYENVGSTEQAASFFASCDACGEAIANPDAADIIRNFTASESRIER